MTEGDVQQQPLQSAVDQGLGRRLKRHHTLLFAGIGSLLIVLGLFEMVVSLPSLVSNDGSNTEKSLTFLVLGDWGRRGEYNQSTVADAMARRAALAGADFVISTGDNFYESGLTSPYDEDFDASFREVYHHKELRVPWYAVLGNHDYGEVDEPEKGPSDCPDQKECFYSPLHQMDSRLKERDSRWHCSRSFMIQDPSQSVDIFFIDTTPILASKYDDVPWATNKGGVLDQDWQSQLEELEVQLSRSKARWKLLVGHHPIHSNHMETRQFAEMVASVEPLITRYNIDAYLCGHDHNLQHIHEEKMGYHQIISGAGSKIGTGFFSKKNSPFQYDQNGFVSVEIRGNKMVIEYFGVDDSVNAPLYSTTVHART